MKNIIIRAIIAALLAAPVVLAVAFVLTSCNVSRVVSNTSEYYQRGDTSVMIQTKTIETYDASKSVDFRY